jgi:hypothetical protein
VPLSVPTGKQKPVTGGRHPVLCQKMPQVIQDRIVRVASFPLVFPCESQVPGAACPCDRTRQRFSG